jgi:3-ketosteroid 9alpha-monooxygenase subunit B
MTGLRSFHRIPVVEVIVETDDAHSLVLAVPPELLARFAYRPGQFLTVRVPSAAGGSARCYSLSSAPQTDTHHTITVKRTPGGPVSNWICDHVKAGDDLEVMPPGGTFTPDSLDRDVLLLAGGSGITPVMSILKAVLAAGTGRVALVYANRDPGSVIFATELGRLQERHGERLRVHHWLDSEAGPPTADALRDLLREYPGWDAFVCGPVPYQRVVGEALADRPAGSVHIEQFDLVQPDPQPSTTDTVSTAEVFLDGQTHHLAWPSDRRLLDVLIDAGLNPPYSCRQGTCGACACRVIGGEVELVHNEVLEDEDFAEQYTLACQALPRTPHVTITYTP